MDTFADMTTMAWDKIHIFTDMASDKMIELYIRGVFVDDDIANMMPSNNNFVKNVTRSDDPPLNISRSKGEQGRQLEALTEGVHDVHHQKFTLPNH
jgi:HSP90 family molecular chaperone